MSAVTGILTTKDHNFFKSLLDDAILIYNKDIIVLEKTGKKSKFLKRIEELCQRN